MIQTLLYLSLKNLRSRLFTFSLSVVTVAVGVMLIFGIGRFREASRDSFFNTVRGVDLIVGSKNAPLNIMLYSVFHIGSPLASLPYQAFTDVRDMPGVAFAIPVSLGDSHRSFRVMGTNTDYFTHFKYGSGQSLEFEQGAPFTGIYDVVIGASVAKTLGYGIGTPITVMHGLSDAGIFKHEGYPFKVSGILAPTGTNVDRLIMITLQGFEAIHLGWKNGVPSENTPLDQTEIELSELSPTNLSAFYVGVSSKIRLFRIQRMINSYLPSPLTAAIPGLALAELWQIVGGIEQGMAGMTLLVFFTALIGLLNTVLISTAQRKYELAVLRSLGAGPGFIALLLITEGILTAFGGIISGAVLLLAMQWGLNRLLLPNLGFELPMQLFSSNEIVYSATIIVSAAVVSLIPAFKAYRQSLHQGMLSDR